MTVSANNMLEKFGFDETIYGVTAEFSMMDYNIRHLSNDERDFEFASRMLVKSAHGFYETLFSSNSLNTILDFHTSVYKCQKDNFQKNVFVLTVGNESAGFAELGFEDAGSERFCQDIWSKRCVQIVYLFFFLIFFCKLI
ncbi:uncharacterized protein LOC133196146 [Saccostrea echinata]|uniref:uncharacterized protein LOC133196146 n=1 Tax=Saccostrea echinata TaxID=191078 RepID=UPI002A81A4F5|nr:uncharacterized protein LOC133196146 [Saccostrea echinata]